MKRKHLTPEPWAPTSNDSFDGSSTLAAILTLQSSPPVASRAEWKGEKATALTSALWPWTQFERAPPALLYLFDLIYQ